MFERFTDRARRVVVLAQEEARIANWGHILPEHILLGIIHEGGSVAWRVLCDRPPTGPEVVENRVTLERVRDLVGEGTGYASGHIPFTPECKKALELSLREALQFGHNYIACEHILLGLIREGSIERVLPDLADVRSRLVHAMADPQKVKDELPPSRTPLNELIEAAADVVDWFWHNGCGNDEAARLLKRLMYALDAERTSA